jgi:hypothetical protein
VPAVAMSEARIAAVSCVALTNVVARALALKLTVEPQRVRRILSVQSDVRGLAARRRLPALSSSLRCSRKC